MKSCQPWTGATSNGYGVVDANGPSRDMAHRAAYRAANGEIPDGFVVHHVCENKLCVEPTHLVALSVSDHIKLHRAMTAPTHCPQGHPYAGDNLYVWRGHRRCRQCIRDCKTRQRRAAKAVR